MNKILQFLFAPEFDDCREEINRENRLAIRLLASLGLPLSIANAVTQYFVVGTNILPRVAWLAVYCALLLVLDRHILPEDAKHTTLRLYLAQAPAMLIVILLGTVWDPERQATTFLMFLMAMPVFVFDRPLRLTLIYALWSALFLWLCRMTKSPELFVVDGIHVLEFFFTSTVVTYVVLWARLRSLRNLNRAQYLLDHDRQTGCLSRHDLASRPKRYLGKPLTVLLCDMDRLGLYRDFYGHDVTDLIFRSFAASLQEAFGADYTYRFGGDEILCVMPDISFASCMERIAACRAHLHDYVHEDRKLPLSFALGYVTGTPSEPKELQEMIQLAEINMHKAKEHGDNQTLGSAFSREQLRKAITDSTISAHARSYEINPLTGLPTMSFFVTRTDEMLSNVVDPSRDAVIGYFKLTNLRDYNNRFGYAQGDRLIADTAKLLRKAFAHRMVCHITAGHFGLMCYRDEAEERLRQVRDALLEYRPQYPVYCSTGLAASSGTESTISLLDNARIALKNRDKKANQLICFYTESLDAGRRLQRYIIEHVDEAIEKGWLQVYYQPIARAITGEVCNEEALSRWEDPENGFLMPVRFIPTLEENDLMYKVNLNVVRLVLRDFARRKELGIPIVPVSLNLSRRDFEQHDMVSAITEMVEESGFPCDLLKIEITESAFISNQELLAQQVEAFHRNGFEVWLDDFGSEFSTLNLLQELDFDLIKLDMRFMKDFAVGSKNYIIVSNVIDMAKRMGVTTLIEGVETQEQYALVRKLGCEKIQGYLFNKPNPFEYIAKRALNGTGLTFEDPEAVPYYEAIGRVDLDSPLTLADDFHVTNEMPTGVVQERGGVFTCLRGTPRFYSLLKEWGVLSDASDRVLTENMPEVYLDAVRRCAPDGSWVNFSTVMRSGQRLNVYLRCVTSVRYRGGTAMLIVLLPGGSVGI